MSEDKSQTYEEMMDEHANSQEQDTQPVEQQAEAPQSLEEMYASYQDDVKEQQEQLQKGQGAVGQAETSLGTEVTETPEALTAKEELQQELAGINAEANNAGAVLEGDSAAGEQKPDYFDDASNEQLLEQIKNGYLDVNNREVFDLGAAGKHRDAFLKSVDIPLATKIQALKSQDLLHDDYIQEALQAENVTSDEIATLLREDTITLTNLNTEQIGTTFPEFENLRVYLVPKLRRGAEQVIASGQGINSASIMDMLGISSRDAWDYLRSVSSENKKGLLDSAKYILTNALHKRKLEREGLVNKETSESELESLKKQNPISETEISALAPAINQFSQELGVKEAAAA